jgi:hypothetical protein
VIAKNQISIVITFSTPSKIYILRSEKLWQKRDVGPEWPADRRAAEQSDERAAFHCPCLPWTERIAHLNMEGDCALPGLGDTKKSPA